MILSNSLEPSSVCVKKESHLTNSIFFYYIRLPFFENYLLDFFVSEIDAKIYYI